ncbi:alkaline phosphatase family protein [Streptomyces melanogenes]|uniref:alkaline phosphatase family protein n=1 Tax=Streptomyces melanogenes TaxID=67326 RepID=UPI0037A10E03
MIRLPRASSLLGLPALALLALSLTAPHGSPPAATAAQPVAKAAALPAFDHVVVVLFENKNYSSITSSSAPYFTNLASQGTLFTKSFALTHPSQPNYIGLFSGSQQGVGNDDCPKNFRTGNLGQQLLSAGKTFKGYSEALPSAGYTGCSSGKYRRKHAPWVDFPTVNGASYNVPFSAFPSDYTKLPSVAFVTPDMCNDMHDCSVGTGDSWLKNRLDGYAQWAKTHNSLLVVTFDEDHSTSVNQIYTAFVGAHVKSGYKSTAQLNHYGLLRTLEDIHGLPALGSAADKSPVTDAWTTS